MVTDLSGVETMEACKLLAVRLVSYLSNRRRSWFGWRRRKAGT